MSSKKGKKSKSQKVSLQEFLATNGTGTGGTTQVVVQKVSSWADECDDDDDRPTRHEVIELPTAPRSARIFEDDSIPYNPPFVAKVSNLPFDTNEGEVEDFFIDKDIVVKEMRLARDDNRLRGFGQIEFEGREDLISALMIPDATIRNRRVRIELATENDNRDKGRRRFDYGPRDGNNDNTNWRDRKESSSGGGGFDDSRRDRDRDSRRGGDYNRSNFQNRHDSNNNDDIVGGWRMGERQLDSSPPPERRRGGFDRNDRNDRSDRNDRRSGSGRDKYERGPAPDEERPVLNLAPRTKPMPVLVFPAEKEIERSSNRRASIENEDDNAEIHSNASNENRDEKEPEVKIVPKPKPVPNAAVFGDAKPVDTAAREREIEAKMDERKARNEAERDERDTDNSEQPEIKKDIIVIKTEKVRLQEEASNWRQHATSDDSSSDPPKNRDNNGRRFNDRRNDDRSRYKDSRNFNNNQRGNNDFRQGNANRGPGRSGGNGNEIRRENIPRKEGGGEIKRQVRDPEERMPKYKPTNGPNLDISNAFAGLDDEVDIE